MEVEEKRGAVVSPDRGVEELEKGKTAGTPGLQGEGRGKERAEKTNAGPRKEAHKNRQEREGKSPCLTKD